MKKSILLVLLAGLILMSCESGVQNTPTDNNSGTILSIINKASATSNGDGTNTYDIVLSMAPEEGNMQRDWKVGIQVNGEENISPLSPNPDGSNTYRWIFTTTNASVFIKYGHYKVTDGVVVWANENNLSKFKKYYIEKDGVKYFGFSFFNGQILQVDKTSLDRLRAIITASSLKIKENTPIRFSGLASTGNANPFSQITGYFWDFGDGQTASGQIVDHVFKAKGNYSVTLTVKDNLGNTQSSSVEIEVFTTAFPPNKLPGGDGIIEFTVDMINHTTTCYVNLSVTHGNHGKAFWWGTYDGVGTPWQFYEIKPVPLHSDWGSIVLPFSGRKQFEFNYSDYYDYLGANDRPVGVNWDHMPLSIFYNIYTEHYSVLVTAEKIERPY